LRYIGPLQQELIGRVAVDPSDLRMLLFGLALVLVMLFRPQGLWPSKVRARELRTDNPDEVRREQESLYDAER
jgi:branched-chain amino acid transport system permease protein